jgi:type IV pilus assembly protein PilM
MRHNRFLRWLVDPEPPGLGIDIRCDALSLVRLSERRKAPEVDLCVTSPLAPGLFRPSMLEPNILDEQGFRQTLENVLLRSGVAGRKRVALSLPDYVARIAVNEIPEAPRSATELTEFLKFRMKKSLPFNVDEARVAFERLPGPGSSFLTGVMHDSVVSQYEDLLASLGLQVGLMLPASVSLLKLLQPVAESELAPGGDYFFVNVEQDYFSVSLVRDRRVPILIRTLGQRAGDDGTRYSEEDLLQEIIPTAIYYREKLAGSHLERVFYRSLRPDLLHLREILEEQFEAPTEPFHLAKAVSFAKDVQLDAVGADAVSAAAGAAVGKAA